MHPWRGQWTHHGQITAAARHKADEDVDDGPSHHRRPQSAPGAIGPDKEETLSTLANRANEGVPRVPAEHQSSPSRAESQEAPQ